MISFNLKYLIILLIIYTDISAQNVFEYQNPYYSPESINSIKFVNQTGWAAGNNGLILNTTNGGLNFSQQYSPSKANFKKVFILDSLTSYTLDDSSRIYKTSNGGTDWIFNSSFNFLINDVYFLNQSTGFEAAETGIGITSNGGANWSFVSPDNSSVYNYFKVSFVNSQTGFVSALNLTNNYSYIFKTTNAGNNWTWYNTTIDAFEINSMCFLNPQTGWCAGSRFEYLYAMKTSNGGINWTESHSSVSSQKPDNIYFGDVNTGYITTPYRIIKSTNGGSNWFTHITGGEYQSSYFMNNSSYYLADNHSRIFKTTDAGNTFDTLLGKHNSSLLKIQSIDGNKLWSSGLNSYNWKTTNGGANWVFDNLSTLLNIHYTTFTDVNTGFALAGRGSVYKTTNFGNNWTSSFEYASEVFSFCYLNSQTLWAFADQSIFKTTNSGVNWITFTNPGNITKAVFFDEQNGFGSNSSYLFRTSNSGVNWTQSSQDLINDYSFINAQTGWTTSGADTMTVIRRTTNGGLNWTQLSVIVANINSIRFMNQSTGYLLAYDKLYRTTNGGITWKYVYISNSLRIFAMDLSDASTGWLCGDNSLIIKLVNGSAISVNNDNNVQSGFQLFQNYPNPFNSSTNIKFVIAKQSLTTLKIYNVQGREVAELTNGTLSPGTYTIRFNYANLPSGVYFYTLTTDSKSITKKLLLLK
ncbi:MAG: YCF48-related protein [Ignavibacteriae bacterium]|nr:YCF48-related protein [Ignavibacteriota bacterium]